MARRAPHLPRPASYVATKALDVAIPDPGRGPRVRTIHTGLGSPTYDIASGAADALLALSALASAEASPSYTPDRNSYIASRRRDAASYLASAIRTLTSARADIERAIIEADARDIETPAPVTA